ESRPRTLRPAAAACRGRGPDSPRLEPRTAAIQPGERRVVRSRGRPIFGGGFAVTRYFAVWKPIFRPPCTSSGRGNPEHFTVSSSRPGDANCCPMLAIPLDLPHVNRLRSPTPCPKRPARHPPNDTRLPRPGGIG
ncbi:hypothetical protein RZS08_15590, partial [Arthrospira platensis SPKY1]|nr:hypothetical protein [Arthrospira platensis SPKY1]